MASSSDISGHEHVKFELNDHQLWLRFKELTNEMIISKVGRRLFPVIKVKATGLQTNSVYTVLLEFKQICEHRWKYVNRKWVAGSQAEIPLDNVVYTHPDSPNLGSHWMDRSISFARVKVTNKINCNGQISLNSAHKYEPRIHLIKVDGNNIQHVQTYSIPEAQFIAVTAYHNHEIIALKIKYNPFAKAYLFARQSRGRCYKKHNFSLCQHPYCLLLTSQLQYQNTIDNLWKSAQFTAKGSPPKFPMSSISSNISFDRTLAVPSYVNTNYTWSGNNRSWSSMSACIPQPSIQRYHTEQSYKDMLLHGRHPYIQSTLPPACVLVPICPLNYNPASWHR